MIGLRLVRRAQPSRAMVLAAPLLAVLLTLVAGLAVFAFLGENPLAAFRAFFLAPVSDVNGVCELLLKASPLCLIALGLAVGYRASIWNIGAEGQMYLGGIFATGLAIHFTQGAWLLPAAARKLVAEKRAAIAAGKLNVFAGPIKAQDGSVKVAAGTALTDKEVDGINWYAEGVEGKLSAK